jgi:hypothetical protein
MFHLKSAPPLSPLLDRVIRMEHAGITVALGGSGLLAALGLADQVRDWDLTTDSALDAVQAALAGENFELHGHDELHADHKLVLDGGSIEVIVRMAFHVDGGVARIPTIVSGRWREIPVGSPEAWAVAYCLLGRGAKADLLFTHLATHGADRSAIERLRGEPLPRDLAARLAALPLR